MNRGRLHSQRAFSLTRRLIIFRAVAGLLGLTNLIFGLPLNQVQGAPLFACQVDRGHEAIEKQGFEWFDPVSSEVRWQPVEPSDRIGTPERTSLAPHSPPMPSSSNVAPWFNWNGRWLGGATHWIDLGLVAILLTIVLIAAILVLKYRQTGDEGRRLSAAGRRELAHQVRNLPYDLGADPADFRQLAESAWLAGNPSQAMIYLFGHVLLLLDRHGAIRLQRGKTNRQYLREARQAPGADTILEPLLGPFESVFFGAHPMDSERFAAFWSELPRWERLLRQPQKDVS